MADVWWGSAAMCGWRADQEDAHLNEIIDLPSGNKGMLVGVFDGHGGSKVSNYAKAHLKEHLTNCDEF